MYELHKITQFQGKQIFDCLQAKNDGKGSIEDIRKMLKLLDKVETVAGEQPHSGVSSLHDVIDTFTKEQRETLTQEEVNKRQEEIWGKVYIGKLQLEDEEFKTLKEAFDSISKAGLIPREKRQAMRFVEFYDILAEAKPFDTNSKKQKGSPEKDTTKKNG